MNIKNEDRSNIEDASRENSLAICIDILADMTRKEVERSLSYFDINNEKQILK